MTFESTSKKLVSSIGTFVAANLIVLEFPILSKDSLMFLNSVGLNTPPLLGKASPIVSFILPLLSIISVFLKSVSATDTKALPFHLGNLPTFVPNKFPTSNPNPPLFVGSVALKFAVPELKSNTPVFADISSARPPCSFGTSFLTTPDEVNPRSAFAAPPSRSPWR